MKFQLDSITLYHPYAHIYPEQYQHMLVLKKILDLNSQCMLEIPQCYGRTSAFLSVITSYQSVHSKIYKTIYCTKNIDNINKILSELQHIIGYMNEAITTQTSKLVAVGLSSRISLCINPEVSHLSSIENIEAHCRTLTSPLVSSLKPITRAKTCPYFKRYDKDIREIKISKGVYSLNDLRRIGQLRHFCPYYFAQHLASIATVIVLSYHCITHQKLNHLLSQIGRNCILIIDEAHDVDKICIESLSVSLTEKTIATANACSLSLIKKICETNKYCNKKFTGGHELFYSEHTKYLESPSTDITTHKRAITPTAKRKKLELTTVPGNIRKNEHYALSLYILTEYLKNKLNNSNPRANSNYVYFDTLETTKYLLQELQAVGLETRTLRFCYKRFRSLSTTLNIKDNNVILQMKLITDFATMIGTYPRSFSLIIEHSRCRHKNLPKRTIKLKCLDVSHVTRQIFENFKTVILTSGIFPNLELYLRILSFNPRIIKTFQVTSFKNHNHLSTLTKVIRLISTRLNYENKFQQNILRNYGIILTSLMSHSSNGFVCFFPNTFLLQTILTKCKNMSPLTNAIYKSKIILIESEDVVESAIAVSKYRKTCHLKLEGIFLGLNIRNIGRRYVALFSFSGLFKIKQNLALRIKCLKTKITDYLSILSFLAIQEVVPIVEWVYQRLKLRDLSSINFDAESRIIEEKNYFRRQVMKLDEYESSTKSFLYGTAVKIIAGQN
jgi:DNA excision repair protein ERCC-2